MRFVRGFPVTTALAVALLFGCDGAQGTADAGTDGGGDGQPDAGPPVDAGPPTYPDSGPRPDAGPSSIQTVFVIVMENKNWAQIFESDSAPYINGLLTRDDASYATQYFNPAHIHPSLPNYIWMEAGDNFGVADDDAPAANHQATTDHLVTQLEAAGVTWRSYQEGIDGTTCPLTSSGLYAPKHNPMIYFDDVAANGTDTASERCIEHVRPYSELANALASGDVAQYNFITPDLCHDMHNSSGCDTNNSVLNGDTWLSQELPAILDSEAYAHNGVVFITWDEGALSDGPIGMIVLSPLAKGHGYNNAITYTHGSYLRTIEEIFGVPFLRDANAQTDLSDLFATFP